MDKNIMEFKLWLKKNRITLQRLSNAMGYSVPHISSVISGKKNMTLPFYNLLLRALEDYGMTDNDEFEDIWEKWWDAEPE